MFLLGLPAATAASACSSGCMGQHLLLTIDQTTFQNVVFERLDGFDTVVDHPENFKA
jgi:hypothetical protein